MLRLLARHFADGEERAVHRLALLQGLPVPFHRIQAGSLCPVDQRPRAGLVVEGTIRVCRVGFSGGGLVKRVPVRSDAGLVLPGRE